MTVTSRAVVEFLDAVRVLLVLVRLFSHLPDAASRTIDALERRLTYETEADLVGESSKRPSGVGCRAR